MKREDEIEIFLSKFLEGYRCGIRRILSFPPSYRDVAADRRVKEYSKTLNVNWKIYCELKGEDPLADYGMWKDIAFLAGRLRAALDVLELEEQEHGGGEPSPRHPRPGFGADHEGGDVRHDFERPVGGDRPSAE